MSLLTVSRNTIQAGDVLNLADAGIRITDAMPGLNTFPNLTIHTNVVNMNRSMLGYSVLNTNRLQFIENRAYLNHPQCTTGFYLENAVGTLLSCNRAEGINYGTGAIGIQADASTGSEFRCNYTENTRTGLQFGNYISTSPNVVIRGNEMGNHWTGLRYTSAVINMSQGLQGNLWTGSYLNTPTDAAAVHEGGTPSSNQYDVSSFTTPVCPPTIAVNMNSYSIGSGTMALSGWFLTSSGFDYLCASNNLNCSPSIINGIVAGSSTNQDYALIEGDVNYEVYPEESEWAARAELYSRILADSSLLQDSLMAAFFENYQDSSAGRFSDVQYQLAESFRLNPIQQVQLENIENQILILSDSLFHADSLLHQSQDTSLYLPLIRQIKGSLTALQAQSDALRIGLETLRQNTYDYLETENGLIPSTRIYEGNEQTLNRIYLSLQESAEGELQTDDIAALAVIAYQCPLAGGPAVYRARALYAGVSNRSYYDDKDLCYQAGLQYRQGAIPQSDVLIYPNPADSYLEIYSLKPEKYTRLEIVNILGESVYKQAFFNPQERVDVSKLTAGIYYLYLIGEQQRSFHKILISH
jgi:Secretion system C-terminal sorting domain